MIVLAFVVLLTGLVVASLSRTQADRTVAHGSFNQSKVDQLAASAAEIVIGDLRQEIVNGSNVPVTVNDKSIYTPSAAANMLPQRSGNPPPVSGVDPLPNLVRRSVRADAIAAPGVSSRASSVNSTTDASHNRRAVSLARWNNHYLLPRHDPASTNIDSTPLSPVASPNGPGDSTGFTPPDWVILTRSGPSEFSAWNSDLSDASKDNYAIGRYAYAVYDEGGLLDVNVAGYPTLASPSTSYSKSVGLKGGLAFADLTVLPAATTTTLPSTQVNSIVGWRNFATTQQPSSSPFPDNFAFTASTADLYAKYVVGNTNGFIKTSDAVWTKPGSNPNPRTDQAIISRQQLLDLRRSAIFSQNTLQYLGTFSRAVNSPSFSPALPNTTNPSFNSIRASATRFTRFDNTPSVQGEPLVKTRFPLSRLGWLTYKGPSGTLAIGKDVDPSVNSPTTSDAVIIQLVASGVPVSTLRAGTAVNIRKYFGLVWDSRAYVAASATTPSIGQQWIYDSPTSSGTGGSFDPASPSGNPASDIKSLATVASENREPDFFELLRAAILDGSLGQNTGGGVTGTVTGGPAVFPDIHMSNKAHHILSIAASIIDQADPDSVPTRLQFKPITAATWWTGYGVESLPYVSEVYPISGFSPAAGNTTKWATYLLFQLSNPHNGPALSPAAPRVRLRVDGNIGVFTGGNGETYASSTNKQTIALPYTGVAMPLAAAAFAPASTPSPIATPGNVTAGPAVGSAAAPAGFEVLPPNVSGTAISNYVGLRLLPDYSLTGATSGTNRPQIMVYLGTGAANTFDVTMEYDAGGGTWVPYNHLVGLNDRSSWVDGAALAVRTANNLPGTPSSSVDQFNTGRLTQSPPYCLMKPDPRSTRFGVFQMNTNPTSTSRLTDPLWPVGATTTAPNGYGGAVADGNPASPGSPVEHAPKRFAPPATGGPYFPATFCVNDGKAQSNRNTVTTSYADNDGVIRIGDAAYADPTKNATGSSTPWSSYTVSSVLQMPYRPVIINRPFRSVAELGYAFRDLPWKSLDLFSDTTADAGLLDVFSVTDEVAIVAGQLNLNTRQMAALQAVLAGTIWDELSLTSTYSKAGTGPDSALTIAPLVTSAMATTAASNRAELVARAGLPTNILPVYSGTTPNQTNQLVKTQREAVARALASVTQTRTWNLMIDVIAQSGRYASGVSDLAKFVVEGEQRYWVHVAIDRFTGEVVDKQIEVVKE